MRYLLLLLAIPLIYSFSPQPKTKSPLSSYGDAWNAPVYAKCNTAAAVSWLTPKEKEVIYILNLARRYPQQFNNSVVKAWPARTNLYLRENSYYLSLRKTLASLKPQSLLRPDSLCWAGARCHAYTSGLKGYVGHKRLADSCRSKQYFSGECCSYGSYEPLQIVMALLIDEDIPSLGHREICLDKSYTKIGVSIQPHHSYGINAVLDFAF